MTDAMNKQAAAERGKTIDIATVSKNTGGVFKSFNFTSTSIV